LGIACGHKTSPIGDHVDHADAGTPSTSVRPSAVSPTRVALDLVAGFDACTVGFRGVTLDLGDPSSRARFGQKLEPASVEVIEREGATWARVRARSLPLTFYASSDEVLGRDVDAGEQAFVELRVRGLAAKNVTVYLDGKPMGVAPLPRGDAGVVTLHGAQAPPGEGEHEIVMRFGGAPRATTDALAEVDWIHIGTGSAEANYAAPTRGDVLSNVTLGGEPMQAISLRAPGFARCTGWIPSGAVVDASLATARPGEAEAQIRILRDRAEPKVLGTVQFSADDNGPRHVQWPVGDLGGETGALAAVELVARSASRGARVVFAAPRVVLPADGAAESRPRTPPDGDKPRVARSAIVVVLGEVSTATLALYGGARGMHELDVFASTGVVFANQRATSSLASAAFASILSGVSAKESTLEDPSARLPRALTTIADAAREAGIAAALFTANPMTGSAFGFDRGWMTYESISPTEDVPAVAVFDHATQWVEAHKREPFLLVIHARGGHPPWDATTEDLKTMPPAGYTGALDAKHAAELLGHVRGGLRWTDADRERAWALYTLALEQHDAAFGRLLQAVHSAGRDADTAVLVTGDVGLNDTGHMPFVDADSLDEAALSVPLVIRMPGAQIGSRIAAPTTGSDLARTIVETLGLQAPSSFGGLNLLEVARKGAPVAERPMVATGAGRFSVRWDRYVLSGARDRESKLCDLGLEPSCVTDVRPTYPLALDILHRVAFDALVATGPGPTHEPATVDTATAAALRAWGR
jgi:arylsulfatase A-like enzyme